jgi:MoaA/NifB/PqqE/SkfB family radical SAM enzyme
VLLEITHHCNLRCSFCESHGSLQPTPITARRQYAGDRRSMSLDAIAVLCRSLARLRAGRVQLSGKGDPMAHPQLAEIVRIIKQARLGCTLVTNGTLGQADLAASLVESRLDHLNVSLNAASPEVYARIAGKNLWESAIGFLREVIERRRAAGAQLPRIGTSYVLCRDNAEDVERMIDLCCELHLDEIRWSVMGELPETRQLQLGAEQFSRLLAGIAGSSRRLEAAGVSHNLRQLATDLRLRPGIHSQQENPLQRRLPCYEGWMFTAIGPDGTVVPCCACENVRLGNVEDEDFSEVWHGARYRDFRRRSLVMPRVGQPICWECFTTCNRAQDNERIHRWLGPLRPR